MNGVQSPFFISKNLFIMKYILFIITTCIINPSFAQKHDYNWIVGSFSLAIEEDTLASVQINFNKSPVGFRYFKSIMPIEQYSAVYSDKNGVLKFYTNGCFIVDFKNQKIDRKSVV